MPCCSCGLTCKRANLLTVEANLSNPQVLIILYVPVMSQNLFMWNLQLTPELLSRPHYKNTEIITIKSCRNKLQLCISNKNNWKQLYSKMPHGFNLSQIGFKYFSHFRYCEIYFYHDHSVFAEGHLPLLN